MTNRYAGKCFRCGVEVGAGEGVASRKPRSDRWQVLCGDEKSCKRRMLGEPRKPMPRYKAFGDKRLIAEARALTERLATHEEYRLVWQGRSEVFELQNRATEELDRRYPAVEFESNHSRNHFEDMAAVLRWIDRVELASQAR